MRGREIMTPHTVVLKAPTKHKLAKAVMAKTERGWDCIQGISLQTFEGGFIYKNGTRHYKGAELYTAVMKRRNA